MSGISIHVLDMSKGHPARNVPVRLEMRGFGETWKPLGKSLTDMDGRIVDMWPSERRLQVGSYRLTFDVAAYFRSEKTASFYPEIIIVFGIHDIAQHYHIPLLLSPFGYTTYRGS